MSTTSYTTFRRPTAATLQDLFFPQWLEYNSINSPDHVIFAYETTLGSGDIKTITWKEMYVAATKAAEYTTSRVDAVETPPPVVAVLANLDTMTYYALLSGIWLAGAVPFLISTRNSVAAIAHLLSRTNTTALFVSLDEQMQSLASAALRIAAPEGGEASDIKVFSTPSHRDIFNSTPIDLEPLKLLPSLTLDSLALILHSSGSTAFPKPITITHRVLREWASGSLSPDANPESFDYRMAVHAAPVFHTMAIVAFVSTVASGMSLGVFPPTDPPIIPSADNFLASAVATKSDFMYTVPRFIELWSQQPEDVEVLKTFKAAAFGGGPLNPGIGHNLFKRGVKLLNVYGTTEIGIIIPQYNTPHPDWEWVDISLPRTNVHFRAIEGDSNHFELVFLIALHHTPSVLNAEVEGVKGYATSDLVIRHPTDPMKVKITGRLDDQIMLSTGEKTNPGPLEAIISRNPLIDGALMFGRGRDQNGIIIQPLNAVDPSDQTAIISFRNTIWPSVEEANEFAPSHSRIFKEMILVAHPDKPFRYTPKQSIRRAASLADYEKEIEELYRVVAESSQRDLVGPTEWSYGDIHEFVRRLVASVMEKELKDEDDIFVQGGDSLRATWIRNTFVRTIRESPHAARVASIGQSFVYSNPTIGKLTAAITALVSEDLESTSSDAVIQKRVDVIEELVAEHTANFPTHRADPARFKGPLDGDVVMITGTTGGLGAQLVATFSAISSVKKIYAVNRSSKQPLHERQRDALTERGLDTSILDGGKVVLVEANTEKADFDISTKLYEEMRDSVTLVIHNAWRVNWVLEVASFKPLLQGTRNLIDFALSSPRSEPPRIIYTGSVSAFTSWSAVSDETPIEGPVPARSAIGNGYSESKYAGERILQAASEVTPLRPVCIRIGQMTGTEAGAWNSTDWVPAITRSGQVLGVLPTLSGSVAWISLDLAARAIYDFRNSPYVHLNLAHPTPFDWSSVFDAFSRELAVPVIAWREWLIKLEGVSTSDPDNKLRNPAAHLLSFFKSASAEDPRLEAPGNVPLMSMRKALESSESLRRAAVETVDIDGDVHKWVAHWKVAGLLD